MSQQPLLLAMMGLPASGKSTLARACSERTGWPVVDRDHIRAAMFPAARWTVAEKAAASDATLASLAVHLRQQQSCIADGRPYSRQSERELLQVLADRHHARLLWIWVDCPLQAAIARIEADQAHPGRDGRANLVREVAARWEPPPSGSLRLEGLRPPPELLESLLGFLRDSAAPSPRAISA